jgi:hypothetical protein
MSTSHAVLRARTSGILAILASLGCTAADEGQQILFAVRDYTRSGVVYSGAGKDIQTLVEPFAYVIKGKLVDIPGETDGKTFENSFYSETKRYTLYSAGRAAGYVQIRQSAFDIQCESLAASVQASPPDAVRGMRMALASDARFRDGGLRRRPPSKDERHVAVELAVTEYVKNKVEIALARKAEGRNITVIEGGTVPMMVASFAVGESAKGPDSDGFDTLHSVFLIAERTDAGQYNTTLVWFHSGTESGIETQDFVDVLDIDGDGTPEIVTQFGYYESNAYHVYKKKTDGKWTDIYSNFGSGC